MSSAAHQVGVMLATVIFSLAVANTACYLAFVSLLYLLPVQLSQAKHFILKYIATKRVAGQDYFLTTADFGMVLANNQQEQIA
jgi:hypothetical protein